VRVPQGMDEPKYYLETDGSVLAGERHKARDWPSVGGAGIVLWDPSMRMVLAEGVHLGEVSGSTEAEFRAVLVGLRRAKDRRVERLRVRTDCVPVVRHLTGEEPLETRWAIAARAELLDLLGSFESVEARWTPTSHATERRAGVPTADALARQAIGLGSRGVRRRSPRGSG
jgi:ribonuclease HI